jgi:hypothetical protein
MERKRTIYVHIFENLLLVTTATSMAATETLRAISRKASMKMPSNFST